MASDKSGPERLRAWADEHHSFRWAAHSFADEWAHEVAGLRSEIAKWKWENHENEVEVEHFDDEVARLTPGPDVVAAATWAATQAKNLIDTYRWFFNDAAMDNESLDTIKKHGERLTTLSEFLLQAATVTRTDRVAPETTAGENPASLHTEECDIFEYDGAFRCHTHHKTWGAITNPDVPCKKERP